MTLEQAIEACSMGAACQVGWDHIIGSLEVGTRADLVVVDQGILEVRSRALIPRPYWEH